MAHTCFYDPSFDYSSITLSGKRGGTDTKKGQKYSPHMYVCIALLYWEIADGYVYLQCSLFL